MYLLKNVVNLSVFNIVGWSYYIIHIKIIENIFVTTCATNFRCPGAPLTIFNDGGREGGPTEVNIL